MTCSRRLMLKGLAAAACGTMSGCVWLTTWMRPRETRCVLRADATGDEVVAHLNQNTAKIRSWKADRVSISSDRTPVSINANLAVEAPRNLRLTAQPSLGSKEVDLGSNQDEFWFWSKRSEEKHIYVASHEQDDSGRLAAHSPGDFQIPFQPDWIMEALGVMPLDPAQVVLEPGIPGTSTVRLISDTISREGRPVRKVTTVDLRGGVVQEHALFNERGQLIAVARMKGHVVDKASRAVLPSTIDLEWPQAQLSLTMRLGTIHVNPQGLNGKLWERPRIEGHEVMRL